MNALERQHERARKRGLYADRHRRTALNGGVAPLPPARHGVLNTAIQWGCQCERCRTVYSVYMHNYRRREAGKGQGHVVATRVPPGTDQG